MGKKLTIETIPPDQVLHLSPFEVACKCGRRLVILVCGHQRPEEVIPLFLGPGQTAEDLLAEVLRAAQASGKPVVQAGEET